MADRVGSVYSYLYAVYDRFGAYVGDSGPGIRLCESRCPVCVDQTGRYVLLGTVCLVVSLTN